MKLNRITNWPSHVLSLLHTRDTQKLLSVSFQLLYQPGPDACENISILKLIHYFQCCMFKATCKEATWVRNAVHIIKIIINIVINILLYSTCTDIFHRQNMCGHATKWIDSNTQAMCATCRLTDTRQLTLTLTLTLLSVHNVAEYNPVRKRYRIL